MQTGLKIVTDFEPADKYRVNRVEQKLKLINNLVDWGKVLLFTRELLPVNSPVANSPGKDLLLKVKILFLQSLYTLSDSETEDLVNDRFSFQKFTGLDSSRIILNFNIVRQFREQLVMCKNFEKLIHFISGLLGEKGVMVRKGTITDAAVIDLNVIGNV